MNKTNGQQELPINNTIHSFQMRLDFYARGKLGDTND